VPLAEVIREDRLRGIPGVGDAVTGIITKLHKTGSHPSLEAKRKAFPGGLLELLTISGLRPDEVSRSSGRGASGSLGVVSRAHEELAGLAGVTSLAEDVP
jgi:DNA polymerase (family X)